MTGWYLSVGYNADYSADVVAAELIQAAERIRRNPELIEQEIRRVEGFRAPDHDVLEPYLDRFQQEGDLALQIDVYPGHPGQATVKLMASGDQPGRSLKSICRRAFCRLVLAEMHAKAMEVNISVG